MNVIIQNGPVLVYTASIATTLAIGWSLRGRFGKKQVVNSPRIITAKPVYLEVAGRVSKLPAKAAKAADISSETDVELIFQDILDSQAHLFGVSQLAVRPRKLSPFKTTVDASAELIREGLMSFLRGTLAAANAVPGTGKVDSVDWKCVESDGRIMIELLMTNRRCDTQSLYMNTLIDTESSAPAHFGRVEKKLSSLLGTVSIEQVSSGTLVRLGMDTQVEAH
jgi:hypothetical protein